jgi:hypothetical protein
MTTNPSTLSEQAFRLVAFALPLHLAPAATK